MFHNLIQKYQKMIAYQQDKCQCDVYVRDVEYGEFEQLHVKHIHHIPLPCAVDEVSQTAGHKHQDRRC